MGLLWGGWGASFEGVIWCKYFSPCRMLKIGLYDLYLKAIVISDIVSKLINSILGQNIARPGGGR